MLHCSSSSFSSPLRSLFLPCTDIGTITSTSTELITTPENNPLVLSCEVPDSLPPATVQWYRGSTSTPFSDSSGRIGQTLDGRLVFSHYALTDNGMFSCEVENEQIAGSSVASSSYFLGGGTEGRARQGGGQWEGEVMECQGFETCKTWYDIAIYVRHSLRIFRY